MRAAAAFQEVEETGGCGECDEGSVQIDCLIVFDITPGIPPIISGPPEQCDPGCGPEIHQIRIMSKDGRHDWTDTCRNIDDASEFACDNWAPEEVDCDDKNTE